MNPQQFNFLGNNTLQNFQNNTGGMINQTSNESEKFPGLTKQQETEIMNKANQANVTESQKNYMLNDMYQQQLRRNQITKFAEERENTKRQLIRRAVESKDIKTSKQSKQIEKKGDVADMIRKYVSATQEIDLNKLNKVSDDQIIADFTADNPDVAYAIDDFTKSQMSSQYFSEMMGFSQFEEQQDEGFFKNLLNSITYGVETGAKGLKGLIDKGLDTVEGNSNESSYSMENLTAFDNYIQHKYGVSGSQLRESDKEVWQQERNLVQDNPEVLKQYMTTASEDALNFAEGYTDALFTATNPYMALGMKTVGATEQEMGGGVLTWLAEKMGGVGEIINSIPGLSNYRDTLSPEDQQRFDAFVGNVAVGLILGTKNKKNIIKDPKTFLMENLQPNQITKNFVQSVTGMPDRLLGGTDSLAGGAKGLLSKAAKGVDRAAEWGAKKITGTATAQDKLYKAQEPRMNILSEKKNLERKRANSDRANELILDNGYKPTNTAERLDAHQKTLNKLWGQVMEKVNAQEGVNVDQSSMITALSDYIKSKKKLGVAGISSDIKALESELKSIKKMQAEGNTDIPTLEAKKQVLNDLIDRKGQEASEVYKGGIKLLTQEIGKIEDSIISQIPGEFSELKRDVGALLDSYEDVFKADMKNQRKKGLGLTETYSRIEGIGDTLGGIVKLFGGDASGLVKGLGKLALGKSLAKASDVDFLIKQGFEDLANEKGLAESQASSKTAKYQVAYHGGGDFDKFDLSHVGEGEGNAAHGYGIYVTENKARAKEYGDLYRNNQYGKEFYGASNDRFVTYKGKKINELGGEENEWLIKQIMEGMQGENAAYPYYDAKSQIARIRGGFNDQFNVWAGRGENSERLRADYNRKIKALESINPKDFKFENPKRNLYKVDIPDKKKVDTPTGSNYLEEGDSISNESYKAINDRLYDEHGVKMQRRGSKTDGKALYDRLTEQLGSQKAASEFLHDMGYDGLHYVGEMDGSSYVLFNDEALNIMDHSKYQKYGVSKAGEKGLSAAEGLNIRNFKNGKTVQELADNYGIKTNIVDSISTPEGQKAYGMYGDRMITLAKDLKESTVPHELLHGVFDIVDNTRKTEILDGIKKRLNVDDVQAEEWLADNFSEYYRTGKFDVKGIPTTFVGKVKQFFQQIKEYIDGTYANRKEIGKLFDDIIDGKIEGEYGVYSDPKFQSVWHGSPYSFEKFDSSHMGEGEGAQAHGWGHYVAVDEKTGRRYADMGGDPGFKWKGLSREQMSRNYLANKTTIEQDMANTVAKNMEYNVEFEGEPNFQGAVNSAINDRERALNLYKNMPEEERKWWREGQLEERIKITEEEINTLKNLKEEDFKYEGNRNLYALDIPDPVKKDTPTGKNFLEEDGKLTEKQIKTFIDKLDVGKSWDDITMEDIAKLQDAEGGWYKQGDEFMKVAKYSTKSMRDILQDILNMYSPNSTLVQDELLSKVGIRTNAQNRILTRLNIEKGNVDGGKMYKMLENYLGSDKAASKFLESLGYDGIHYFGGRDGEAYVIFNDDALQITKHHKY